MSWQPTLLGLFCWDAITLWSAALNPAPGAKHGARTSCEDGAYTFRSPRCIHLEAVALFRECGIPKQQKPSLVTVTGDIPSQGYVFSWLDGYWLLLCWNLKTCGELLYPAWYNWIFLKLRWVNFLEPCLLAENCCTFSRHSQQPDTWDDGMIQTQHDPLSSF